MIYAFRDMLDYMYIVAEEILDRHSDLIELYEVPFILVKTIWVCFEVFC